MKPRLLDLFCGAGGAASGYAAAGFDVTGVDKRPMPRYPFRFVQADALEYAAAHGHEYDAIHASPPCQKYTSLSTRHSEREYPDLIPPTRALLQKIGRPYVIENVEGAPMAGPFVTLCGTALGLGTVSGDLRRHRLFELSSTWMLVPPCQHRRDRPAIGVYGHSGGIEKRKGGTPRSTLDDWKRAMEIEWMTQDEIAQAIPPAYTRFIGEQLRRALTSEAAA